MRSPADMDILLVDITNRCFLNCSNCTRLIAHQTSTREISPEQFREALRSLRGWLTPGKVIGLIGGEPTLHSQFGELCRIFREEINPGHDCTHGRLPIADMNAYANQRLFDRSNGRGLWTSFGPRFLKHFEEISDTFSHWNPNDHSVGGLHQALLIHRDDYCRETGMTVSQWEANRDKCWVQNLWSGTVNTYGAYPCEVMATLDATLYGGKHAWPVTDDWWKRTPDQFGDMLELCNHCSLAQPGPSTVDALDRDTISETNRIALEVVNSHAVRAGRFDPFTGISTGREVTTKDSYTNGPRVSPDNASVRPRKLSGVTVCVGRSDHLRQTIRHNARHLDEQVVVTTSADTETQAIVRATPGVKLVVSDSCYDGYDSFNLGRMQNAGLARLEAGHDWIVFFTCDVFLHEGLLSFVKTHTLNPGVLFGVPRDDVDEAGHVFPRSAVDVEPNGYFQLWHPNAKALRGRAWPNIVSDKFCSAGSVDSWFMQQWPSDKRCILTDMPVRHIHHADTLGQGWNGGQAELFPTWRQFGMITGRGLIRIHEPPTGPLHIRLTDTLKANQWEGTLGDGRRIPDDVLRSNGRGGLVFLGDDIGGHHLHAAWRDQPR